MLSFSTKLTLGISAIIITLCPTGIWAQDSVNGKYNQAAAECLQMAKQALDSGQLEKALQELKSCAKSHPQSTEAHFALGMAYFFSKDPKSAVQEFLEVRKLDPENIDSQVMLAKIYSFDKQKVDLAQELLERLVKLRPDSLDIRFDLARVYAHKGEVQKSFGEFAFILDAESKFALYRTELAKIFLAGDEKEGAKQMLERALVIDPKFTPAREMLDQLNGQSGEKKTP